MKKTPADPYKNPLGTIARLSRQNKLMDLDIDYGHLLSKEEQDFMVRFTLELVGDRKVCEEQADEPTRKKNTRTRGQLQSDAMSIRQDVDDFYALEVIDPQPSPELQAMYNELESRGELPEQLAAAAKIKARRMRKR